ncbi:MAG TPA: hypothetical protein VKW76_03030 [Candidatus Binatia bacterium]|nr:hypothetical protein [Candidatus Binatia bacterium]
MVVTEVFQNLARAAARAHGYAALRMLVLPHPMEGRPQAEVRALARARLPELVGLIAAAF